MNKQKKRFGELPGLILPIGKKGVSIYGLMAKSFQKNSAERTKAFAEENKTVVPGRTVFLGDSLINLLDLEKDFPGIPAYNRGIASETTYEIGARLKESVYDLKPSRVVFLAGMNDLFRELHSPEETIRDYAKVLDDIVAFDPNIEIFCESVYPTRDGSLFLAAELNDKIVALNEKIRALCEERGYTYIDVHSHLKGADGMAQKHLCKDGVHPLPEGVKIVISVVTPYLMKE